MNEVNVPTMLSVEEVRKKFAISKQYTYHLAKSGKVKAIKCGNRFLLNAQSISDYLNSSTLIDEQSVQVAGIRKLK
jgi:excisionase family DNA binding protein